MRNKNAAAIKQIRAAIAPFYAYPNCKYSQRIFSDKVNNAQSYKLPVLTNPQAALAAIQALNIPNINKLRLFAVKRSYLTQKHTTVRFTLPRCS